MNHDNLYSVVAYFVRFGKHVNKLFFDSEP